MPDFSLQKVAISIKHKIYERQMFIVDSVIAYICMRLYWLIDDGLFVTSSTNTKLGDDNVIFRLGGDKGGKEMQFKFVFLCYEPGNGNSPESFDICVTLDALDTFTNLQSAIFNSKIGGKEEMEIIFDLRTLPRFFIVSKSSNDECLLVALMRQMPPNIQTKADIGIVLLNEGTLTDEIFVKGLLRVQDDTHFFFRVQNNEVFCIFLMNKKQSTSTIYAGVKFERNLSVNKINTLAVRMMKLHSFLSGDIQFLSTVLGHQGCSPTYFCYYCFMSS